MGDVNNQPPLFQQDVYTASVAENREPGESVVTVSSTDKDSGTYHSGYCYFFQIVFHCSVQMENTEQKNKSHSFLSICSASIIYRRYCSALASASSQRKK